MKQYDLLIVDDEKRFANMLAKRLSLRGANCEICYNGRQALEQVGQKNFFLVLLDLHLPDIYGVDVLKGIKSISPMTHVIIVTGHGTEKDRLACMQLGARAFMNKPVGLDELMNILDQLEEASQ